MADFCTSTSFTYFVVPLLAVFLGVFVKVASRNDRYSTFSKEDIAIGLDLALTAIIALVTYSVSQAQRVTSSRNIAQPNITDHGNKVDSGLWLIVFLIFGLWLISTAVRKIGWRNKNELTWLCGIVLPFLYGISALLFVMFWVSSDIEKLTSQRLIFVVSISLFGALCGILLGNSYRIKWKVKVWQLDRRLKKAHERKDKERIRKLEFRLCSLKLYSSPSEMDQGTAIRQLVELQDNETEEVFRILAGRLGNKPKLSSEIRELILSTLIDLPSMDRQ